MPDHPLTPEMRFTLSWLVCDGELWLHRFGQDEDVVLRRGSAMQGLDRTTLYELLRDDLITPARVGRWFTRFEITELGRQRAREW